LASLIHNARKIMTRSWLCLSRVGIALLLLAGCDHGEATAPAPAPAPAGPTANEPISALPSVQTNMAEVELGRRLYFDPILSGDGSVSCATCHSLDHGGAEDRRTSRGIGGHIGPINAPTVLNAGFNFRQFWDGRAADLQEQAGGPVENPGEMGATFAQVIPRIQADEWYPTHFAQVFGEGDTITKANITHAIAEYERSLVTPSPVDRYLAGQADALDAQQLRGYALFKSVGCAGCHAGVGVGGNSYQKLGAVEDYFALRGGEQTDADQGRFNVSQDEADRHRFKVPTLRNVAESGPYFHDGSEPALAGAVRTMARVQLGQRLTTDQVADLVAFLGALSGELPAHARLPADQAPPSRAIAAPPAGDVAARPAVDMAL